MMRAMTRPALLAAAVLAFCVPAFAQTAPVDAPSPNQVAEAAPQSDWKTIAPNSLLVMTLAPDAAGNSRQVVIQLMPPPFSQGWVDNIRTFARAHWYDNISVNRAQDNYVVQWGDVNYDNPEATGKTKPLPQGLKIMGEADYAAPLPVRLKDLWNKQLHEQLQQPATAETGGKPGGSENPRDSYALKVGFIGGWPVASNIRTSYWPVHCYGMVGVGRNYSPDTGSGAELYTVIGTPPRQLDRNIALVGRVIEGMENLSSLPRGKGELGFYAADETGKRTLIQSVRIASDLPPAQQPKFEYLSTASASFAKYADARANRRDKFYIAPAGGADICNIPVPIRRAK